jgi:hypothetical protein
MSQPDEFPLLSRLGETLHENDRLRRLLTYNLGRVDELKRRLHIYRDRTEAVEIARLHGVIAGQKASIDLLSGAPERIKESLRAHFRATVDAGELERAEARYAEGVAMEAVDLAELIARPPLWLGA